MAKKQNAAYVCCGIKVYVAIFLKYSVKGVS